MSHSIEPITQRFGDDKRTYRTELSGELRLSSSTAVTATVDPGKGQGLVKIGGCHIHGVLDDLEVVAAAFAFVVSAMTGKQAPDEDEAPTSATLCTTCTVTHSREVPCSTVGSSKSLSRAYERMAKTHMITPVAAGLFVDAAKMFVERGDLVAAKMLLHQFVMDDVADEVVGILVRVQQADAWTPPPRYQVVDEDWPAQQSIPSRNGASRNGASRNGADHD